MTPDPLTLVARVRALGIAIRADGDTLVLAPRGVVPPDLRAALVAAKPAVLAMLRAAPALPVAPTAALRAAYRRWFTLTVAEADGAPIDRLEPSALHQQIIRLTTTPAPSGPMPSTPTSCGASAGTRAAAGSVAPWGMRPPTSWETEPMTREIEATPAALLPHTHALMAIQRALPTWTVPDLARATTSSALGRLTRHVTGCARCRRQGMHGPLCPRALALTRDADRHPRPRPEMANPASRRLARWRRIGGLR